MLFQSPEYLFLFLPISLAGYFGIGKACLKQETTEAGKQGFLYGNLWLIAVSLFFYGCFHVLFPALLLVSALVTYALGVWMRRPEAAGERQPGDVVAKGSVPETSRKKAVTVLTTLGILAHLGVLFLYKYYDFFLGQFGGEGARPLQLLLPVGLSFTTFRQIAFLSECRRGGFADCTLTEYLAFITFFPTLVQGPITLPQDFMPQLRDPARRRWNAEAVCDGVLLFFFGLAKKVLLADVLAPVVRFGYDAAPYLDTLTILVLLVLYAFQLYFDFSGYCDMAMGTAKMFGFTLPDNFRSPFQAHTIKELWQRWHMSLSAFFTRYVYIPLGGSRKGRARTLCNVLIVFVLSAVWHGAGWTYLCWGLMEGLFVVGGELMTGNRERVARKGLPGALQVVRTNALFCLGLIFFNAKDMAQALTLFQRLFFVTWPGFLYRMAAQLSVPEAYLPLQAVTRLMPQAENAAHLALLLLILLIGGIVMASPRAAVCLEKGRRAKRRALLYAFLITWSVASLSGVGEFLYFAF